VGKYHAVQDGEIIARRNGHAEEKAEPMVVEDHHEAIIDKRTFERVQAKLAKNQKHTAHRGGNQYVFSGLLRCGDCGGPMYGYPARNHPRYGCTTYRVQGASVCHRNGIYEAPLLDVVARKLQEHLFSESAIEKLLTLYRKRLAARRKVVPVDDGRLRKRLDEVNKQIDQGAERVLSAPENLVSTIYAKLDKLRVERDRLQAQLNAAGQPETGSCALDEEKVEEAARVLRDLREAFQDAEREEVRELLEPLVAKVELHFDHERRGKLDQSCFKHGTIFVRPTDPQLSILFTTSSTRGSPRTSCSRRAEAWTSFASSRPCAPAGRSPGSRRACGPGR
jgi:site-specific DNA recombinase